MDSHANMVVLGSHAFIFDKVQDTTCDVAPFDPSLGTSKSIPVVDGAVAYDCPVTQNTTILVFRNALHVKTLGHNLIPPFILREAGIIVNDTAKIHLKDPGKHDHAIVCPNDDLLIPLSLNGIFSFFHTRLPTTEEVQTCPVICMTPDGAQWDPYSEHYAANEESMIDAFGEMVEQRFRKRHCLGIGSVSSVKAEICSAIIDNNMAMTDQFPSFHDIIDKVSLPSGYMNVSATASTPSGVSAEFLSKIWHVKQEEAEKAIQQSTQLCRQGFENGLSRHFSTNDRMLRYRRLDSHFFTDTFFVTKSGKSSRGNTCAQLFVSDKGYVALYPLKSKGDFPQALKQFCKDVGVPLKLVCDPSGEQTSSNVKSFCHKVGMTLRVLEESTQWANRAELYIGLFKESVRRDLRRSNAPMAFWDYCAERRCLIHNVLPKSLFQLNGSNPTAVTLGTQPDISNICQFDWYDWCYYRHESNAKFPFQKESLGRVLGPFRNEGNEMAQAVLQMNGTVVPRRSCRPLTLAEKNSVVEQEMRKRFDEGILKKFGDSMSLPKPDDTELLPPSDFTIDEEDEPPLIPDEDPVDATGKAVYEQPFTDMLIHAEVLLPQGEEMKSGKVIGRSKDNTGATYGTYNENPLLNSIIYDVEFPNGEVREYAANLIAQNMYSQIDSEGHSYSILDTVLDYATDDSAVPMSQKYITTRSGQKRLCQTTAGWHLLVLYKDGREQWVPLKLLKESNPIEVAEFAVNRDIHKEPAFAYWVPFVLKKRDRIVATVNSRIRKTTHKYGIEVPTSIEHAKRIDQLNGNRFWQDAIDKEMRNVIVAFEIMDEGEQAPLGWLKSSGHLVFDVKMDFTRKARWVKDGHRTPDPERSTFAGVVSCESVRIALTYAALNDVKVTACDIKNAYLQAPSSEKHYVVCGLEFGIENQGRIALIRRALYGGKSSGADFWRHLRTCMEHLGFQSCKADGDIWLRPALKDNGDKYWEYVLLYVDDALCISDDGENFINNQLGKYFFIKEGSVGPPSIYLGNKVNYVTLANGANAWSLSSSQYVHAAVQNVETYLSEQNQALPKRASSPFTREYRPEVDVTPELEPAEAAYYQSLIGILRWIVELGRVDITTEVSLMSSCLALPRQGHLQQLYHLFAYLKNHHNSEMVFDPSEPDIDESKFQREDWSASVYGKGSEILPINKPEERGHGFKIRAFVDSDHAGNSLTRRSRTGFIVYLNNAPVYWSSKRQTSVQTSSFGSEFIAMKECCEYLRGLRYKLRMMGIPCDFPSYIYGDNQSVLVNSTIPTSVLKKKSSSTAYHHVREGVANDEWRITYVPTDQNIPDLLTKPLPKGEKRYRFVKGILHHIY